LLGLCFIEEKNVKINNGLNNSLVTH